VAKFEHYEGFPAYCSRCNCLVDFGGRGDGPGIQIPLGRDEVPIHRLAQEEFGSYIFCDFSCARACGFDPYNHDVRPSAIAWDGARVRFAVVTKDAWPTGKKVAVGDVEQYLPSNYTASRVNSGCIYIKGVDRQGWTLDGYVLPRLASGLIPAKEVQKHG